MVLCTLCIAIFTPRLYPLLPALYGWQCFILHRETSLSLVKTCEHGCQIGCRVFITMLRSQRLLINGQRPQKERLGLLLSSLVSVEAGQVTQRGSGFRMLRSPRLLKEGCQIGGREHSNGPFRVLCRLIHWVYHRFLQRGCLCIRGYSVTSQEKLINYAPLMTLLLVYSTKGQQHTSQQLACIVLQNKILVEYTD